MTYAIPPTVAPITDPVTSFQNIQVPPQPGVASATKQTGNIASNPQRGPRMYHLGGQLVTPTSNPMSSRAEDQPPTAMLPRRPSSLNLYGIGPWKKRGTHARTSPRRRQTSGYGTAIPTARLEIHQGNAESCSPRVLDVLSFDNMADRLDRSTHGHHAWVVSQHRKRTAAEAA